MAGGSVSELVIFIAAVSVAAAVSGVMVTTVGGIAGSLDERGGDIAADIATDIEIISDPTTDAVYDAPTDRIRLLVKNTGQRAIATTDSGLEVLVDGRYVPADAYDLTVLNADTWQDGAVARLLVNETLAPGDHRVTVIVNQQRETLGIRR